MKYSDNLYVTITSQLKMTLERHNTDTCSMQCILEKGQPVKTTFMGLFLRKFVIKGTISTDKNTRSAMGGM